MRSPWPFSCFPASHDEDEVFRREAVQTSEGAGVCELHGSCFGCQAHLPKVFPGTAKAFQGDTVENDPPAWLETLRHGIKNPNEMSAASADEDCVRIL